MSDIFFSSFAISSESFHFFLHLVTFCFCSFHFFLHIFFAHLATSHSSTRTHRTRITCSEWPACELYPCWRSGKSHTLWEEIITNHPRELCFLLRSEFSYSEHETFSAVLHLTTTSVSRRLRWTWHHRATMSSHHTAMWRCAWVFSHHREVLHRYLSMTASWRFLSPDCSHTRDRYRSDKEKWVHLFHRRKN